VAEHAPHRPLDRHEVFQTGTMGALLDGIYDGDCSVEHLLTRGIDTLPVPAHLDLLRHDTGLLLLGR
jgi:hypothetical protein